MKKKEDMSRYSVRASVQNFLKDFKSGAKEVKNLAKETIFETVRDLGLPCLNASNEVELANGLDFADFYVDIKRLESHKTTVNANWKL